MDYTFTIRFVFSVKISLNNSGVCQLLTLDTSGQLSLFVVCVWWGSGFGPDQSWQLIFGFVFISRMVPTDVERLREGQGVLERVLRSIKMERGYKRSEGSSEKESGMIRNSPADKLRSQSHNYDVPTIQKRKKKGVELILLSVFSDADRYEVGAVSPMTSPHRNSPSVYSQQVRTFNQWGKHPHNKIIIEAVICIQNTLDTMLLSKT